MRKPTLLDPGFGQRLCKFAGEWNIIAEACTPGSKRRSRRITVATQL